MNPFFSPSVSGPASPGNPDIQAARLGPPEGTLLAFPDQHDPCLQGALKQGEFPGPIISLLYNKAFHSVHLFLLPMLQPRVDELRAAIAAVAPAMTVYLVDCSDYHEHHPLDLLPTIREKTRAIRDGIPDLPLTVCLGGVMYPHLQAAVLGLAIAGELPARIITVRHLQMITPTMPRFAEIDFSSGLFQGETLDEPIPSGDSVTKDIPLRTRAEQFGIIGAHDSMRRLIDMCAILAPSPLPMLLLGETGTGKGILARYIHALSGRPVSRFVPVNCAAIPENLVESALFGHKKGAFTGAITDQIGKFDLADGGTLFLDEIGEMPLRTQAKLLRVIEDGMVDVLGSRASHKVDARIIAATNQDLPALIKQGRFRADLYYRMNMGEVHIPPLRERREDIAGITLHILRRINASLPVPKFFTNQALLALEARDWPGNIRELENVLERTLRLCPKQIIDARDLFFPNASLSEPPASGEAWRPGLPLERHLAEVRHAAVLHALELCGGNQSAAAKMLGMTPQAVSKHLKRHPRNDRVLPSPLPD